LDLFTPEFTAYSEYVKKPHDDFPNHEYCHFPLILDPSQSLWEIGCLYLLKKLESFKQPNPATLASQAADLIAFMNFLEERQLKYSVIPRRKAARPTYQFRFHLQDQVNSASIAQTTANRRMNAVINFYRWISKYKGYEFQYPAWTERSAIIKFENHIGLQQSKMVQTTNLGFRTCSSSDGFGNYIFDGGKLKPLSKQKQISVLKALMDLGNVEMTLIFLLALSTGARLQTICTLRLSCLRADHKITDGEVRVAAGPGTLIDTKLNKSAIVYIPVWVLNKIRTYSKSPRAHHRRQRNLVYGNSDEQYIFLTKGGSPYYMGRKDPSIGLVKRIPSGNSITQFIRSYLIPKLKELGHPFEFRFHDLRATYGVNLVEINQKKLTSGTITYQKLKNFIRERMWHERTETTDGYLQFKSEQKFLTEVQKDYENHLNMLMNGSLINDQK